MNLSGLATNPHKLHTMSNIHIISDLHLSHTNMALKRGFDSAEQYDEYIISQWNRVITKRDVVWVLGDITMEKSSPYPLLDKLNGIKKVVLGNHDLPQHIPELLKYVNCVCGSFTKAKCIFTHIPIHPFELDRYRYNIHGHVHEKSLPDSRYINVSCEVVDYTPVRLDKLLKQ